MSSTKKQIRPTEVLIDTYKDLHEGIRRKRGFTLVFTFSRAWCIHNFFANLNQIKIPLFNCHLLVIDNTYFSQIAKELFDKLQIYKNVFKSIRLIKTYEPYGGILVPKIRQRVPGSAGIHIFNMHLEMLKYIKTNKFVLIEDDTLVPKNAIPRLLKILKENKDCAIATGIEPTQTPNKYIPTRLGVHYIKRKGNVLLERLSLPPFKKGLREVDACGWYCMAARTEIYKKGFKGMAKYLNKIPHFALDSIQTNNVKKLGYKILADFSINCKHMSLTGSSKGMKIFFSEKKQSVPMIDTYLKKYDIYTAGSKVVWDKKLLKEWNIKETEKYTQPGEL